MLEKQKTMDRGKYFDKLSKRREARRQVGAWVNSEEAVTPHEDCASYCMQQWAEREKCHHDRGPAESCGEECLERFARYRFCKHVAIRCNFCQMVVNKGGCGCYGDTSDEDEPEGGTQQSYMEKAPVDNDDDEDDDDRMEGWTAVEHETYKLG